MPPALLPRECALASPVTTLLLPLALLLHAARVYSDTNAFRIRERKLPRQLNESMELSCEVLLPTQSGCSWLFQRREGPPLFLVYLSSSRNKVADSLTSKIKGKKEAPSQYSLTLNHFQEHDQGYYFCTVTHNWAIHFSSVVSVFLPVKCGHQPKLTSLLVEPGRRAGWRRDGFCFGGGGGADALCGAQDARSWLWRPPLKGQAVPAPSPLPARRVRTRNGKLRSRGSRKGARIAGSSPQPRLDVAPAAKTTTAPPPPQPTNASQRVTLSPAECRPSAGSDVITKRLDFSCNIYVWAPLAGTCSLLLLSLITVLIYNHRNRKRVCKCPRPQLRQGNKISPERYV
ncbi:PREDICTED: T-cell surface glycoprotein CD8 alpha chain [Condylura cristata]|uniref:T-cell surface glycoprotein CD8 alpha chain n=1 Tax=Condylura cristata TaxID=143302 RepID=UPI0003346321|nr:PREDICTED: T-cell surface glycoprotein CD8 alpha chain [Condylura cristata]